MLDKVDVKAAITITTGALVLTHKIYMNDAVAAAFAAVTGAHAYPVVTYGGSGSGYVTVVTTVTPDAPIGVYAEAEKFLQPYGSAGQGTINP